MSKNKKDNLTIIESDSKKIKDSTDVNIGLIGLGYIGSEVFSLIQKQKDYISKKIGKNLNIIAVAEADLSSKKDITGKHKDIKFTSNAYEVLENDSIDIIVELIGGVDPAYDYIAR